MPRRSTTPRPDELAATCGSHVVHVADLQGCGLSRRTIAQRCQPGGPWQRLLPGVVMLHNGPPSRADRQRAALVYAGEQSVITGLDALELHGMERMPGPSGPVHMLIPQGRRRIGAGWVLAERTERVPAPTPGARPLAPPARAGLDFSRRCQNRGQVRAVLAELVQRGRCRPADLVAELAAGSQRGSALPRTVLAEVSDGVRSAAEAAARQVALRSGLTPPMWNPLLYDSTGRFIARPDAWFDDVGLAWEIDSYEFHLAPADYARTLDRRSAMMAEGIVVMHTRPTKLQTAEPVVLDELVRTHGQASLRPRPPIMAVPAA